MAEDGQDDLEARRKRLESELGSLRKDEVSEQAKTAASAKNRKEMSKGLKLSSEFMAAIFAGFMIGYLLDRFAGTGPWGLIVFILLGFCAGVLNVLRSVGYVAEPEDRLKKDGE